MSDTTDKPSIAELRRFQERLSAGLWTRSEADAVRDAASVLLELAAAALAQRDAGCTCIGRMGTHYAECEITKAEHALADALAKVRP